VHCVQLKKQAGNDFNCSMCVGYEFVCSLVPVYKNLFFCLVAWYERWRRSL